MKPSAARPSAGQTALRFPKLKEKGTTVEPPTKKVRKSRCTTGWDDPPPDQWERIPQDLRDEYGLIADAVLNEIERLGLVRPARAEPADRALAGDDKRSKLTKFLVRRDGPLKP
jgi:hypothetical protein